MGGNVTDVVNKLCCASEREGELEKLDSAGIIIEVCILRLELYNKSISSGNYLTGVLNDDSLKGRQMRHQNWKLKAD